ncbi:hypothetical protein F5888DRAFT_1109764 [Russula emetica]|nr:hypothetical protein F5888DRAFT_1109764 [Russula emetica]
MGGRSEGLLTVDNYPRRWIRSDKRSRLRRQLIIFYMLPDDVLLDIFDFYVDEDMGEDFEPQRIQGWITLAHVCRRWRSVVFQSPRRLNLRLLCTPKTPARDLDIWPPFPLIISSGNFDDELPEMDNIIAALEHNSRVCQIDLDGLFSSELESVTDSAAILKPFPELTLLRLGMDLEDEDVDDEYDGLELPDSFLDGTAPRLRSLKLSDVPFPGLPKLLLSAAHLVYLDLFNISHSGYIPPEAMATSLSALISLEFLRLHFRYPPHPDLESRRPPPPPLTRSILPSLTRVWFKGASEYLEEILARIDAPQLNELHITFFDEILFDTPQLFQFFSRRPTLRAPEIGRIEFSYKAIIVKFLGRPSNYGILSVQVSCTASEWQLSSL